MSETTIDLDAKQIEELKSGSKKAFQIVFNTYAPKIHAFALSYLKNKSEAEELLQDVFLKLWEKRDKLDSSKNIKALLFKICINLIYDHIRHRNVHDAYLSYCSQNLPANDNETWQNIIYRDMLGLLQKIISSMPEQMQRIYRLSKEEGLSNDEISEKLSLSKRTVENQLYRASSLIKKNLSTQESALIGLCIFLLS